MFVELLPLWEEFCRYRDAAKLADDKRKNTVDGQQQQRRGPRSVKSAIRPQARDKQNANPKVVFCRPFIAVIAIVVVITRATLQRGC